MGLIGVPLIISPDLLFILSTMGHGDEIVLGDAHFPTSGICKNGPKEVRADGHSVPDLLRAILKLFPLDTYDMPAAMMDLVPNDKKAGLPVPIRHTCQNILREATSDNTTIEYVERFQFYERAKKAFAVVATGETAKYGNIILKKGLVNYDC